MYNPVQVTVVRIPDVYVLVCTSMYKYEQVLDLHLGMYRYVLVYTKLTFSRKVYASMCGTIGL